VNLLTTPFIPAASSALSLREVFAESAQIPSLALPPHERISVLRLLIAIAQDAIGPQSASALNKISAKDLVAAVSDYLEQDEIVSGFELFGEGPRFLQFRTEKEKTTPCSKIFLHLATGNNPTLLDHAGGTDRAFAKADLALTLLTYQNFSPLIGRGYKGRGPSVDGNALHTFRLGNNLAETILENLLSEKDTAPYPEGMGTPIWRKPPTSQSILQPDTDPVGRNATLSYLGRLVPMSRSIWLEDDCSNLILDNGFLYPGIEKARESTTTKMIKTKKNAPDEYYLLSAKLDRGIWRDLPAILRSGDAAPATPVMARHREKKTDRKLWCGGMVTDYKAKVLDTISAEFSGPLALPEELLSSSGVNRFQKGLAAAEVWEGALRKGLFAYATEMKLDPKKRLPDLQRIAKGQFWDRLESNLPMLFELIRNPPEGRSEDPYTDSPWHWACKRTVGQVYADTCPSDTPRQSMAHARGLRMLWPKNPAKSKKTAA